AFPGDERVHGLSDQYMLGDALLVKPVTRSLKDGGGTAEAVLPEGGWYDLFTEAYEPGGARVTVETPLDRFPVFIRAGSILPVSGDACCAADLKVPADELLVFSGADGTFTLYDDEGDGMDYLRGAYLKIPFSWEEGTGTLLAGKAEGTLPARARLQIRLIRPDGLSETRTLEYDGEPVNLKFQ
ncbi:MAG: DUF5110 domain-containing protein, partial [Lachnospiraceae bacterium]